MHLTASVSTRCNDIGGSFSGMALTDEGGKALLEVIPQLTKLQHLR
jgi:hypothetical protein